MKTHTGYCRYCGITLIREIRNKTPVCNDCQLQKRLYQEWKRSEENKKKANKIFRQRNKVHKK